VLSSALHTLLSSPLLARHAMFPHSSGKAFNELSESDDFAPPQKAQRGSAKGGKRAGQMLLSALKHASPLRLTTHEAGAKRKHALKERDALAAKLGALALALTPTHDASSPRTPSSPSMQAKDDSKSPALRTSLEEQVAHLARAIETESASAQGGDVRSTLRSVLLKLAVNSGGNSGALSISPALRPAPVGLGPPTFLARAWPTLVLAPVASVVLLRIAARNWDAVLAHLRDARETVRGFVIGWVWEPVRGLLETVRHGDQEGMIITKESLRSDVSVSTRMCQRLSHRWLTLAVAEPGAYGSRLLKGAVRHGRRAAEARGQPRARRRPERGAAHLREGAQGEQRPRMCALQLSLLTTPRSLPSSPP
jgi:nuclear-control-of-ATPase protein 2